MIDTQAIRARAEAATPGPWEWWRDPSLLEDGVHAPDHPSAKRNESGELVDAVTVCRGMTGPNREANAQFIAAARSDVPALCDAYEAKCDEVEKLRARVKELERDDSSWVGEVLSMVDTALKAHGVDTAPMFFDDQVHRVFRERDTLRAALGKYGKHLGSCALRAPVPFGDKDAWKCSCGLDALLSDRSE